MASRLVNIADRADDGDIGVAIRRVASLRLDQLRINTANGLVPLSNFVSLEPIPNVDTIERHNGIPSRKY